MFLNLLRRRNPRFLNTITELHRAGLLPVNTYVIDLDAVEANARAFADEASRLGLRVFAMTKQIGRNPDVSRALIRAGITKAVGVDLQCAIAAANGGLEIGHLGHLVQVPRHEASQAASLAPDYWTVFSETKAREAGRAASEAGRVQKVLLRVTGDGDRFYTGHEGGFEVETIVSAADLIDSIPGLAFAGVTTFPATLYDEASQSIRATPNRATLSRAKDLLTAAGRVDVEVNAPGTTSVSALTGLAADGATQVEPGHGLTGTTPLHAVQDLIEEPAIAYLSEVSHLVGDTAYVFGGGFYVDPVLGTSETRALVIGPDESVRDVDPVPVEMPQPEAIDYYATIPAHPSRPMNEGDTVIFGFRPQVFVTRALTAAVSGISTGSPVVEGIWAADGSAPLTPTPKGSPS